MATNFFSRHKKNPVRFLYPLPLYPLITLVPYPLVHVRTLLLVLILALLVVLIRNPFL